MTIYSIAYKQEFAEIEAEFEGRVYGDFKPAVGEAVVELCAIRERRTPSEDKHTLSRLPSGAERASASAASLRKVHKKVGFVER